MRPGEAPQNEMMTVARAAQAAGDAIDQLVELMAKQPGAVGENQLRELAHARATIKRVEMGTQPERRERPTLREAMDAAMPQRPQR